MSIWILDFFQVMFKPSPAANGGRTMWQAVEFNRISWYFNLPAKMELKCYFSHPLTHPPLLFLLPDSAGSVQFIGHRSRYLPSGGPLLPHTLLLLSPWWPERGIRGGGGGRRWQHRSRLQREEGAGHLLCHVGGRGSCHTVLVRSRTQSSLSPTELLHVMATHTSRPLSVEEAVHTSLLK